MNKKNKGFTLIELLLVIALIVIITASVVISYLSISKKEKIKNYDIMVKNISTAAELYLEQNILIGETLRENGYVSIEVKTLVEEGLLEDYYTVDPLTQENVSELCVNINIGEELGEYNFSEPNVCGSYLSMTTLKLFEYEVDEASELDDILYRTKILVINKDGISLTDNNTNSDRFKDLGVKIKSINKMPNELDENEKPELSNLVLGTNEVYYEYDGKYFKRKVIVNKNLVCNLKDKNGNSLGVIRNEKTYALVEPTESEIPKNKIFVGWKITINGIEKIVSKENNIFTCEDGTIEGTEVIIEPKFESTIFVVNINKDVGIEKVIPVGCTEKESNKKYECPFDSLINLEVYSNVGYTVSTIVSDNSKASIKYLSSSNNKKTYSLENNELEEVILTASSTVNSYTITYNASGGSPATSSKTISYNTNYILPSNPTKSCGTFKGWFTEATGGTQITASTIMNRVENHTVYAQWDSNTSGGSWGTCSGGTCSGCSVATNSGTQTNTCGATRSCTPTKDCTSAGSWGTCSGGSCSGCSVATNSGSQTNTCGAKRSCTPSKDCTSNGSWGTCSGGYCSGCSAASYSGSQRNSCGATRSCTPSLNCSTNGYWQGCSGGYCSGCSAAAYSGTEYNTCGGSRSCTPSLDCSSNAQVYTGSYYCGGATCGYAYCQNSCGGQTYTYLGQCVSLYCNAYMGQSTFSCNASPVSAPAQAQANMSLTSCALYGCKNSCGCSVMGQYATASGGTIGTYPCSQWAGSHTLTFYVYSSSGSASCSTSYYVTN